MAEILNNVIKNIFEISVARDAAVKYFRYCQLSPANADQLTAFVESHSFTFAVYLFLGIFILSDIERIGHKSDCDHAEDRSLQCFI